MAYEDYRFRSRSSLHYHMRLGSGVPRFIKIVFVERGTQRVPLVYSGLKMASVVYITNRDVTLNFHAGDSVNQSNVPFESCRAVHHFVSVTVICQLTAVLATLDLSVFVHVTQNDAFDPTFMFGPARQNRHCGSQNRETHQARWSINYPQCTAVGSRCL